MVALDPFDLATETRFATVGSIVHKALSAIDADPDVLERAIGHRDPHAATAAMRSASMAAIIENELPGALGRQLHVAGKEEAKGAEVVVKASGVHEVLKGVATIAWHFDLNVEQAIRWAEQKAAGLVVEIDASTRDAIRALVVRAMRSGGHPYAVARDIRGLIGLHSRWALAVYNRQIALEAAGIAPARVAELTSAYYSSLLQTRSETIARTEILDASNQGRFAAWGDAISQGYLAPEATKSWLVAPDCTDPNCLEVADQEVGVTEEFDTPMGPMMMPPMHPNCRCTAVLNVGEDQVDLSPDASDGTDGMTSEDLLAMIPDTLGGIDAIEALGPADEFGVADESLGGAMGDETAARMAAAEIPPVGEGFSGGDAAWAERQAAEATRARAADVAARAQAEREAVAREAAARQEIEAAAERDAARAADDTERETALPKGKTIGDTRIGESGGDEGVNQSWKGHIEGDGDVVIKPQSGFHDGVLRAGIKPGSDIPNEVAAYRVNEQLGGLVRMGATEDRNAFFPGGTTSDRSVVQEFVKDADTFAHEDLSATDASEADQRAFAIFDSVIGNMDRHVGNVMMDASDRVWAIDHGLAFPDAALRSAELFEGEVWQSNAIFLQRSITLTDAETQMLRQFLEREAAVREELRAVGLTQNQIDSMYARVRWMIEEGRTPKFSGPKDVDEFLTLGPVDLDTSMPAEAATITADSSNFNAVYDAAAEKWENAVRFGFDPATQPWFKMLSPDVQAALKEFFA